MPQSSSASVPSARTSTLPAWMSPWNAPAHNVVANHTRMHSCSSGVGSTPSAAMAVGVVDGDAVEQLHRDHVRAAVLVEDRRHHETIDLDLPSTVPNQRSERASLPKSSSSAICTSRPCTSPESVPAMPTATWRAMNRHSGRSTARSTAMRRVDVGPQHLHRDRRAVVQHGPVHDGERGGGDRLGVERCVQLTQRRGRDRSR